MGLIQGTEERRATSEKREQIVTTRIGTVENIILRVEKSNKSEEKESSRRR